MNNMLMHQDSGYCARQNRLNSRTAENILNSKTGNRHPSDLDNSIGARQSPFQHLAETMSTVIASVRTYPI